MLMLSGREKHQQVSETVGMMSSTPSRAVNVSRPTQVSSAPGTKSASHKPLRISSRSLSVQILRIDATPANISAPMAMQIQ